MKRIVFVIAHWLIVLPLVTIFCVVSACLFLVLWVGLTIILLPLNLIVCVIEIIPEAPRLRLDKETKKTKKKIRRMLRKHKYITLVVHDPLLEHIAASLDLPVMNVPWHFSLNGSDFFGSVFVLRLSNNIVKVEFLDESILEYAKTRQIAQIDLNDPDSLSNLKRAIHQEIY